MRESLKIILFLALLGFVAALFSLPYIYGLLGDVLEEARLELGLSEHLYNAILIAQATLFYALAALIGGSLYRRAGFRLPVLERAFGQTEEPVVWRAWLAWSLGTGVAVAVVIIVGDYIFFRLGSPLSLFVSELPAWWAGMLAAFAAGVGEELLMRFLLMTLLTLLFLRVFRLGQDAAVWIAIVVVAFVFGLLHLPATAELTALTPLIVVRGILLNALAGIAFGYLYWKRGLEAAMAAHFVADLFIHGVTPLFV